MADLIHEFGAKVKLAIHAALSCQSMAPRLLDLCNRWRRYPVPEPLQQTVGQAIGLSQGTINNWMIGKGRPYPGQVLDFVAILGMAPDPATLEKLELGYQTATMQLSVYPKETYRILDRWNDRSSALRCWAAFAGSAYQLTQWQHPSPTNKSPNTRGADAEVFSKVFRESLGSLTPQLLDVVHWDRHLPSRAQFRVPRGFYDDLTGTAASLRDVNAEVRAVPMTFGGDSSEPEPGSLEWMDPQNADRLFDVQLPSVGLSRFEIEEKATLYGGRSGLDGRFSQIEHVVAGHTFDRENVRTLLREIRASTSSCSSFALTALPGSGLSLALAQVVHDLAADPTLKTMWVIGEAERTKRAISFLSDQLAEELVTYVRKLRGVERVVIVLDDVSLSPDDHVLRLIRFRQRCKTALQTWPAPKFTFVFGSFGAARTCSEDGNIPLDLTTADQVACYEKMARHEPTIIGGRPGGLAEIIKARPEARWYKDDAQALIDFLLEHGRPKAEAIEYWLARTDSADIVESEIVGLAAVAQLIGLSIPEGVATTLFANLRVPRFHDAEEIVRQCKGTAVIEDDWRGVGLSCPRRAKSILERTGRFSADNLLHAFSRFVEVSLSRYEDGKPGSDDALDFAGHIFQRLSKSKLFVFSDKIRIVEHLVDNFIPHLTRISADWSLAQRTRWAGTLSGILTSNPNDAAKLRCAEFVLELCKFALSEIEAALVTTDIAVSILRAGRRLLSSKLLPIKAEDFVERLLQTFDKSVIKGILEAHFEQRNGNHIAYRANELIHVYCSICRDIENVQRGRRPITYQFFEMTNWLFDIERLFANYDAALDAGSWLQRAYYVRIRNGDSRVHDLNFRRQFIDRAYSCIEFHPQSQGTWTTEAHKARSALNREFEKVQSSNRGVGNHG